MSCELLARMFDLRATAYMLSAHILSQFRLSVCLSVRPSVSLSDTGADQSKTVEVRIMQFSPYENVGCRL